MQKYNFNKHHIFSMNLPSTNCDVSLYESKKHILFEKLFHKNHNITIGINFYIIIGFYISFKCNYKFLKINLSSVNCDDSIYESLKRFSVEKDFHKFHNITISFNFLFKGLNLHQNVSVRGPNPVNSEASLYDSWNLLILKIGITNFNTFIFLQARIKHNPPPYSSSNYFSHILGTFTNSLPVLFPRFVHVEAMP